MNTEDLLKFPDHLFPPPKDKEDEYRKMIESGEQFCSDKSVIVCGICRDIESVIENNILRIYKTVAPFKDYRIVIYENDSSDQTPDIISKYSNKDEKLHFVTDSRADANYRQNILSGDDWDHFERARILGECRNVYMDYLNNLDGIDGFDFVIVIDLDILGWSYEGISHSFSLFREADDKLGCVSSYGVLSGVSNTLRLEDVEPISYLFFDTFAFRPMDEEKPKDLARYNNIRYQRMDAPALVRSNFNGLAIYRREAFVPYRYGAKRWSPGVVDNEHNVFHQSMRKAGWQIVLNPSMITSYSHHKYSR
jgi:hypothetical protein